ncbi:MAG: patatin-like phospholipase family protein [bacterium]|nr:patatin-like phospholipase family protein [bacterium]
MKKAIVLSGGGSKGAFSVGVAKKLLQQGNVYDIFSGTSTGALIIPLLATGEIELLEKIYTSVEEKDILIKFSNEQLALRILTSNSLYEVTPLNELIRKTITKERYEKIMSSGKILFFSTVALQNGKITYFTNSNLKGSSKYNVSKWKDREELIKIILASSVQPVIMPPVSISGQQYVDGGVREYLPVDAVIDEGAEDVTCIMTTTGNSYYDKSKFDNLKDILLKTIEIFSNDVSDNDVRLAEIYNKGISYVEECKERVIRFTGISEDEAQTLFTSDKNPFFGKRKLDLKIIRPKKELGDGLQFSKAEMREQLNYGYDLLKDPDSVKDLS